MIVSLSGGLDSTTLLAWALKNSDSVKPIGFSYNSKHNDSEVKAARRVCRHYGLEYRVISLHSAFYWHSSHLLQGQGPIPEGHYEEQSMKDTVVPGRNLMFASVLAGIAESEHEPSVALGVHSGDHTIYPDCRPEFFLSLSETVRLSSEDNVRVVTPFIAIDKVEIVRLGLQMEVPYYLTRTCYQGAEVACGRCGSCQERLAAFAANGVDDPIEYMTRMILPKKAG